MERDTTSFGRGVYRNQWGEERIVRWMVRGSSRVVDRHGRCIPPRWLGDQIDRPNKRFTIAQPQLLHEDVVVRIQDHLGSAISVMDPIDFEREIDERRQELRQHKQAKNLLRGVYVPMMLPGLRLRDYGQTLEELLLPAVQRAYEEAFPGSQFCNCCRTRLSGRVNVVPSTWHDRTLQAMAMVPRAALYFPRALQGFSVSAARQMIEMFGVEFALCGAVEPALAVIVAPRVFAANWNTTGLDCAALSWESPLQSLCFRTAPDSDRLDFDQRGLNATNDTSSGILYLGIT